MQLQYHMAVVHFYCVTVLAVCLCVLLLMDSYIFENYMDNSVQSCLSLYAHVHHFYLVCT